jgi:hypothetical protein
MGEPGKIDGGDFERRALDAGTAASSRYHRLVRKRRIFSRGSGHGQPLQ